LRQLFANLIGNAIDAVGREGRLWLSARHSRSWVDGAPGVRVFVSDNGCGMLPETRNHIFEPFFTTKETTGTGLGLWVSSEIITKHNGTVRFASRPGRGTVFMVFFPEGEIGVPPVPALAAAAVQNVLT
jgi:signal transduction histidine kinase